MISSQPQKNTTQRILLFPTPSGREPSVVSPHIRESKTVLDFTFHALDSGFRIPDSRHRIPVFVGETQDSLSCISDCKSQGFRLHKQNFPGFRILQTNIFKIPESWFPYMERLVYHLMKEGCSQEEHQQQHDIGYFESNTIGCNRRHSLWLAKAGFHLAAFERLNGAVIVNNVFGVVVLHGTQHIQL